MTSDSAKTTTSSVPVRQNNGGPVQITETVDFSRQPPPPYTISSAVEVHQPQIIHRITQQTLKDHPSIQVCEACGETVLTDVRYVNTQKTHLCAGFICGCGLWCFLCCLGYLPYRLRMCKKAKHYCPNCDHLIGEH